MFTNLTALVVPQIAQTQPGFISHLISLFAIGPIDLRAFLDSPSLILSSQHQYQHQQNLLGATAYINPFALHVALCLFLLIKLTPHLTSTNIGNALAAIFFIPWQFTYQLGYRNLPDLKPGAELLAFRILSTALLAPLWTCAFALFMLMYAAATVYSFVARCWTRSAGGWSVVARESDLEIALERRMCKGCREDESVHRQRLEALEKRQMEVTQGRSELERERAELEREKQEVERKKKEVEERLNRIEAAAERQRVLFRRLMQAEREKEREGGMQWVQSPREITPPLTPKLGAETRQLMMV